MGCQGVEIYNLFCDVQAPDLSVFPLMTVADTLEGLTTDYWLTEVLLTSSLLNYSSALLGVAVIIGQNEKQVSYSDSVISPVIHFSNNNSLVGPPVVPIPTNKSTPVPFPDPYPITPSTQISLFTFGTNDVGNLNRVSAFLSIQMVKRQ